MFSLKLLDSKEGRSLLLLLILASMGFRYMRQKPHSVAYQNEHSAEIAAAQTSDGAGRISVRPPGAEEDLFHYFHADSAARLTQLQPLNGTELVASFHARLAGNQKIAPIDRRYQGWFENENKESANSLPLVRSYRAINGEVRVEDAGSGTTLFTYGANAAYQPVAVVKKTEPISGTVWQVVFSSKPGMLSQSAAP